jgi:PAS domain S-box-containing protein
MGFKSPRDLLERLGRLRILALCLALSVLAIVPVVMALQWLLQRRLGQDFLLTGLVVAILVALLVGALVIDLVSGQRHRAAASPGGTVRGDDSEQGLFERRLEQSSQTYRGILNSLDEAVYIQDRSGQFLDVNEGVARMYGHPREYFIGKTPEPLSAPGRNDLARVAALVQRAFEGAPQSFEFWGLRANGEVFPKEVHVYPGSYFGRPAVIAVAQDITERRRAEAALRESEQRWSFALDGAGDGVWDWRVGSAEMFLSPRAKLLAGFAADEVENRFEEWTKRIHPQDLPKVMANLQAYLAGDIPVYLMEHRLQAKNGETRWILIRGTAVERDRDGAPLRMVGTATDITASKEATAELERHRHHLEDMVAERTLALSVAKEAAEAASRAKSVFLANMSHELRTPMNVIMGMTELARRRTTDSKVNDQLGKVLGSAQRLLMIINDVLDISRIEADRLALESRRFRLGDVLDQVTGVTEHQAAAKGLALVVEIAPGLADRPLQGDPLRLGQILLNLASNAIKFTPSGSVSIRAGAIEERDGRTLLRFEVEDSGIGISPEHQERIFLSFEQADGSTTRRYGGTGLGLAISRRLVQMMGGDIGVVSRPGAGSTFWFTARFEDATAEAGREPVSSGTAAEEALRTRHRGASILLVEDEPVTQEVSRSLLEEAGLSVDLAENGAVAVDLARDGAYALILMDMEMPLMDGITSTRIIRALPGGERTPILAMTANAFESDRQACLDAGMDDHVAKPVDPARFFETLLLWLDRRGPAADPRGRSPDRDRGAVAPSRGDPARSES